VCRDEERAAAEADESLTELTGQRPLDHLSNSGAGIGVGASERFCNGADAGAGGSHFGDLVF
jgi:hypothetical protein